MTKEQLKYIHIFKKDGKNYVYIDSTNNIDIDKTEEKLGSANITIMYKKGATYISITDDCGLTLYFDRSGKLYCYDKDGNDISNVSEIKFTNNAKSSIVKISKVTGKCYIE